MDGPQILRWKILNGKLRKSEKNGGFFLAYLCDAEERLLEKNLNWNYDKCREEVDDDIMKIFHKIYEGMIKAGEIELPKNKSELIELVAFDSESGEADLHDFFCFKPNIKLVKKVFAETIKNWRLDTGVSRKSYDIQEKYVIDHLRNFGSKERYRLKPRDFKGDIDFFDCIFSLENSGGCRIIDINFDNLFVDVSLPYISGSKIKNFETIWVPVGTKWEDIVITFLNPDTICITGKKINEKRTCEAMGFLNYHTMKQNKQWELLKVLAEYRGELSGRDKGFDTKNMKRAELLGKTLKKIFKISDSPLYPYKKYKAIKVKFTLIPESDKDMISRKKVMENNTPAYSDLKDHYSERTPSVYEK